MITIPRGAGKMSGYTLKKLRKARIAQMVKPAGALEPTVGQRMRRMSPWERDEVHKLMRSLLLRHAIRQTLYLHFHNLHQLPRNTSLQRLRAHAVEQDSNSKLQQEFHELRTPFELHVTNREQSRIIVS